MTHVAKYQIIWDIWQRYLNYRYNFRIPLSGSTTIPKLFFSIIIVLSISFLLPNSFSSHILASSQKLISHHNAITRTIPIYNSNKTDGLLKTAIGNKTKVVILSFGDTVKSQFTTAKPILDQYGFKASFFITCGYVGTQIQLNPTSNLSCVSVIA